MKTLNLILYLLLFAVAPVAQSSEKQEVEALHSEVYDLLDSNLDKALRLSKDAEIMAKEAGLDFEEANSLFIQAYIYRQLDELGKSFVINLKALEILRPLEDENSLITYVKVLLNTGEILKQHHAYSDAVRYYDEAIAIANTNDFSDRLTRLHYSKGMALMLNGNYDYALEELNQSLESSIRLNDEYLYVLTLNQIGLLNKHKGMYQHARESYQTIIDHKFEKLNSSEYLGQAWHNIAVTFKMEERFDEALQAYEKAENYHAIQSGDSDKLTTWLDLSEVYLLRKEYYKASEYSRKSLGIYEKVALLPEHYRVFDLLSQIAYAQKEFDDAHSYSQKYVQANKQFLEAQEEILRIKDQYKMEVLTAGFFVELNASKRQSELELYLIIIGVISVIVILIGRSQAFIKKKSIQIGLTQIEKDSSV